MFELVSCILTVPCQQTWEGNRHQDVAVPVLPDLQQGSSLQIGIYKQAAQSVAHPPLILICL